MYCAKCLKSIPDESRICPYCGAIPVVESRQTAQSTSSQGYAAPRQQAPKKSKKKLFLIGFGLLFAFLLLIIFVDDDDSVGTTPDSDDVTSFSTTSSFSVDSPVVATTVLPPTSIVTTEAEELTNSTGIVVSDFYKRLGKTYDDEYFLSTATATLMDENAVFFPCADADLPDLQEQVEYIRYEVLIKSPTSNATSFIYLENIDVADIQERNGYTYVHVCDENMNSYVGWCIGSLPDVFAGDIVTLYGIPLDVVYFDNMGGKTTKAIMMAICTCVKY